MAQIIHLPKTVELMLFLVTIGTIVILEYSTSRVATIVLLQHTFRMLACLFLFLFQLFLRAYFLQRRWIALSEDLFEGEEHYWLKPPHTACRVFQSINALKPNTRSRARYDLEAISYNKLPTCGPTGSSNPVQISLFQIITS